MRLLAISSAVVIAGCTIGNDNASGLTKNEAASLVEQQGYEDPILGGSPDGWTGKAWKYGYPFQVIVGKNGVVTAHADTESTSP